MRNAYGGRAAAYERKGDYDRAAADYGMIVFSYAVEIDAADAKSDGYRDLLRDAARAYRTRAACLRAGGAGGAAARDVRRAEKLETKAKQADEKDAATAAAPPKPLRQVAVRNAWTDTVTIVIAGASYTLRVGESVKISAPAATFPYEL